MAGAIAVWSSCVSRFRALYAAEITFNVPTIGRTFEPDVTVSHFTSVRERECVYVYTS